MSNQVITSTENPDGAYCYILTCDAISDSTVDGKSPLGVVGYFALQEQKIADAKVWHFFADGTTSLRGSWLSDCVGFIESGLMFEFYMAASDTSAETIQNDREGDYNGLMRFTRIEQAPALGEFAYAGIFADFPPQRATYRGKAYVERLAAATIDASTQEQILSNAQKLLEKS